MNAPQQALVPGGNAEATTVIRKSRFIARARHAATREQAMAFVEAVRRDHPNARHHCWAYLLGDPQSTASAAKHDDGEPSGTAGQPILNVIQHKGIGDVVVVVTRYFGGIKLGRGGLVRAYAGACEAVMAQLPLTCHTPQSTCTLYADFAHEQSIRHWCTRYDAEITSVNYGEQVAIGLAVPQRRLDDLHAFCDARSITIT